MPRITCGYCSSGTGRFKHHQDVAPRVAARSALVLHEAVELEHGVLLLDVERRDHRQEDVGAGDAGVERVDHQVHGVEVALVAPDLDVDHAAFVELDAQAVVEEADPAAALQPVGDAVVVMRIAQEDRRHLVSRTRSVPPDLCRPGNLRLRGRSRQAFAVEHSHSTVRRGPMAHRRVAARLAARVARQRVGGLEPRQLFVDMDVIGRHGGKRIIERADIEVDLGVAAGRVGQRRAAAAAMGARDAGRGRIGDRRAARASGNSPAARTRRLRPATRYAGGSSRNGNAGSSPARRGIRSGCRRTGSAR